MKKLFILLILIINMLYSCDIINEIESNDDETENSFYINESSDDFVDDSLYVEPYKFYVDVEDYSNNDGYYYFMSYNDWINDYPEYNGKWRITEFLGANKLVNDDYYYITETFVDKEFEIKNDKINILDQIFEFDSEVRMCIFNVFEFCFENNLYYNKLYLPQSYEDFLSFYLSIKNVINNDELYHLETFSFVMFENNKMMVSINSYFFIAERQT